MARGRETVYPTAMFRFQKYNINAVIRDAANRFRKAGLTFGHGTHDALDEAAFLVLETLGLPPDTDLKSCKGRKLTVAEREKIEALVRARIETRKPAPYLLNRAYVQGFPFYVDERVIVPRSFIGEILFREDGFDPPGFPRKIETVLDLCTGSGCLAILAAQLFPEARIDASDLSPDALDVARRNVADYGLESRVTLFEGDLFKPLGTKRYDLIITNPPYVDAQGMRELPPEYRHEPPMALGSEAGEDGMALIRRIVDEAPAHLTPQGGLLCEVGRGRENILHAWPRLPFLWIDTAASAGEVFWIPRRKMDVPKTAAVIA